MLKKIKVLLARFGHFLIERFDEAKAEVAVIEQKLVTVEIPYLESAKKMVLQVERIEGSGEFKAHEALRALMNIHPEARARDLRYAIESALQ